jgi:hypothetical protein
VKALALVALAACWTGTPSATAPEPAPPEPTPARVPRDAAPAISNEELDDVLLAGGSIAPTPGAQPPSPNACPSGGGVAARIIAVSVQGADTIVTILSGTDQGVDRSWSVTQPALGCVFVRIEKTRSILRCTATADQIRAVPFALLCAP